MDAFSGLEGIRPQVAQAASFGASLLGSPVCQPPLVSVYADHLSALVTVKDNYLSALAGQIESESEMI